jgi:hypothetical protein
MKLPVPLLSPPQWEKGSDRPFYRAGRRDQPGGPAPIFLRVNSAAGQFSVIVSGKYNESILLLFQRGVDSPQR